MEWKFGNLQTTPAAINAAIIYMVKKITIRSKFFIITIFYENALVLLYRLSSWKRISSATMLKT